VIYLFGIKDPGRASIVVMLTDGDVATLRTGTLLMNLPSQVLDQAARAHGLRDRRDYFELGISLIIGHVPGATTDQDLADAVRSVNPGVDTAIRIDTPNQQQEDGT
jgi:hypothetical protein